MRTNFNFTQLDKYQLSSPGAPLSPTSLVMHHSKIFLLDQVTICCTLRLPLPRGDSVIANCLHLVLLLHSPPRLPWKRKSWHGRPFVAFCGQTWKSITKLLPASQGLDPHPTVWVTSSNRGWEGVVLCSWEVGMGLAITQEVSGGDGNKKYSFIPNIIRLFRSKKHIYFKHKSQYSKEILS